MICKHKQIFIYEFGVESKAIAKILDRNVSKNQMVTIDDELSVERFNSMNDRAMMDDDLSFISVNRGNTSQIKPQFLSIETGNISAIENQAIIPAGSPRSLKKAYM